MTKQYLKQRLYQHQYDCKERNRNKTEKTALAVHHFTEGHNFDFEKVEILDTESNYNKRTLSEMIHIFLNNTVNSRTDVANLSLHYNHILNTYQESFLRST